jgi:hypothetical protein
VVFTKKLDLAKKVITHMLYQHDTFANETRENKSIAGLAFCIASMRET